MISARPVKLFLAGCRPYNALIPLYYARNEAITCIEYLISSRDLNDLTIISIIILVGCWAVPLGALLLPTIGVYGRVG
jgi:hypothetical protein